MVAMSIKERKPLILPDESSKVDTTVESEIKTKITCPYCQMPFVVMGVIVTEDSEELIEQAWVDFCPYCGKNLVQKNSE